MRNLATCLAAAAALTVVGFAAATDTFAAGTDLRVERLPSQTAKLSSATTHQEGEELVISGKVTQLHRFYLAGHVDIVLCGPDGKPLVEAKAKIFSHSSRRGGLREARFSTRLPMTPPAGSTVRLRYHAPGEKEQEIGCV